MKKIILTTLIILPLILAGCISKKPVVPVTNTNTATSTSVIDTSDWKTYRNKEYGFEFKYPKEWGYVYQKGSPHLIALDGKYKGKDGNVLEILDISDIEIGVNSINSDRNLYNTKRKETSTLEIFKSSSGMEYWVKPSVYYGQDPLWSLSNNREYYFFGSSYWGLISCKIETHLTYDRWEPANSVQLCNKFVDFFKLITTP